MQKKSIVNDLPVAKMYRPVQPREWRSRLHTIMKVTFIQITVAMIFSGVSIAFDNHAQEILDRRVSLELKNITLTEALWAIENKASVKFVYSPGQLNLLEKVSIDASHTKLGSLLTRLLAPRSISFKAQEVGNYIVLVGSENPEPTSELKEATPEAVLLQATVSGTVTDSKDNPLPGVSIVVKGTTKGTTTDVDGRYSLLLNDADVTLVFSFIGYTSQEVALNGRSLIDVILEQSLQTLDEVVVVGYATQKKINLTGSVQQINGEELASQASVQTSAALMGKIPGIQIIQNSGQPGSNQGTIRIRGTGTLGDSNPLVLIDGIPGNINNIPSGDIASVSVLKDAAAAAVYGSRGANGVILITTKRGTTEGVKVTYNGFVGWATPTDQPEFVDGGTFMRLQNLGAQNVGMAPVWSDTYISQWAANHVTDPDNYPSTDWVKEAFTEPGLQQRHSISIAGGTKAVRMLGSVTYDDENSNIPNYGFDRYSIRLNSDFKASDKLDFKFDVNLVKNDRIMPTQGLGRILVDIYRVPAVYTAKFSHGGWGPAFNLHNPIAYIHDGGLERTETWMGRARLGVGYELLEGLTANVIYAPDVQILNEKAMVKSYDITNAAGDFVQKMPGINSLRQESATTFNHNLNAILQYEKALGLNNVSVLAGYEYITFNTASFKASREQFQLQDFEQLNAGSVASQLNSGTASEWALRSVFGRLNYNYNSRYLFEANLRYDGSSRFTRENRWGVFPSFSAGWVVSQESFMKEVEFVSALKVRGSWGMLGNQQIGTYPFVSTIDLGEAYILGGSPVAGAAQLGQANPEITWETTATTNLGFDVSLLEDRFDVSLDLFQRRTSDILLRLPVPLIMGLTAPVQNAGEVENSGWEIESRYKSKIGSDLLFQVGFNIASVKNRVTDLRGAGPVISGSTITTEGAPIGVIYGYESAGLFQSQAEIDAHADQPGQIAPGDIKYVDQNGDGIINADDRKIIGDPFPSLNYGATISAQYKGFDLSILFQGVGRRDVYLSSYATWPLFNGSNIRKWQAEDYWTPENPGASMPRFTPGSTHSNFTASDFWVFDASYLRLRNVQIGYNLTATWPKLPVENVRVYVMGENLFTAFDKMPQGVDPNVPNGDTYFPISRLFTVGLNVTF